MKKAIITLLLCILSGFCIEIGAQTQNIESCFVSMPESLLPHLSVNDRKDLLDLYKAGQESRVNGRFGQAIRLESLNTQTLTLSLSEISTLQIAIFATKAGQVIAVIQTAKLPAADSRINFYDTQWRPLDSHAFFMPPTAEDFFSGNKKEKAEAVCMIHILPVEYKFDGNVLLASQNLKNCLPEETYKNIEAHLLTVPLTYKWNGKRFVR